jgi:hypothetical protein
MLTLKLRHLVHKILGDASFDVIVERMSEVRKGTFRNMKNENKRHKIYRFFSNMVYHINWELCK